LRCSRSAALAHQDERGHLMRLKWLPHVGRLWSAVGDHGTWIIVNTNMAGKPNWWLCVHPWDSNDFEERGNFPNREAAQAHAQDREDGVPNQAQGSAK
jgi:hypothetical protein